MNEKNMKKIIKKAIDREKEKEIAERKLAEMREEDAIDAKYRKKIVK